MPRNQYLPSFLHHLAILYFDLTGLTYFNITSESSDAALDALHQFRSLPEINDNIKHRNRRNNRLELIKYGRYIQTNYGHIVNQHLEEVSNSKCENVKNDKTIDSFLNKSTELTLEQLNIHCKSSLIAFSSSGLFDEKADSLLLSSIRDHLSTHYEFSGPLKTNSNSLILKYKLDGLKIASDVTKEYKFFFGDCVTSSMSSCLFGHQNHHFITRYMLATALIKNGLFEEAKNVAVIR